MDIATKKEKFEAKIRELYPALADEVLHCIESSKPKSFWVVDRADSEGVLGSLRSEGFEFEQTPLKDTYRIVQSEKPLSHSEAFTNQQIYIQDLSSMLPVLELFIDDESHARVLDLCAAPGSKTIQMAKQYKYAELHAVEKNRKRFFTLQQNCNKYGCKSVVFYNKDGRFLTQSHPEFIQYFDKILLDVLCSSEGRITLNNKMRLEYWHPRKEKEMAKQQKKLIESAFAMLKPGGTLVYATCTFSVRENEAIVDSLLQKHPDATVQSPDELLQIKDLEIHPGFTEHDGKEFGDSISKTVRIVPNEWFSGFYVAKIRKDKPQRIKI